VSEYFSITGTPNSSKWFSANVDGINLGDAYYCVTPWPNSFANFNSTVYHEFPVPWNVQRLAIFFQFVIFLDVLVKLELLLNGVHNVLPITLIPVRSIVLLSPIFLFSVVG